MTAGALCRSCSPGQRPEVYVVSLAGTCCKCAVSAKESSVCGTCESTAGGDCQECSEFNGYFELRQTSDDCDRYVHEFADGEGPCGATSIELRLNPDEESGRTNVCVHIHFDQSGGAVRPVSWGKTGVKNCCEIGCLRRRSDNRKCCWPHEITVTPVPVPDFTAPQPEWFRGDPDDLNDAPFWPTLDLDLREDSPEAPVRYFNGELQLRIKDIGSDGFGVPWGHTRIYSNRLSNSYDFGNGYNWMIHELPRLVRLKTPTEKIEKFHPELEEEKDESKKQKPTGCTVVVLRGTRNALWFDEVKASGGASEWLPRFGAKHCLVHDNQEKCLFYLGAPNGQRWVFYDFTCRHSKALQWMKFSLEERKKRAPGGMLRHIGPGGQETLVTYEECRVLTVERFEIQQEGKAGATVTRSASERKPAEVYTYKYFDKEPHKDRIQHVTLSRNGKDIARAEYVYYNAGDKYGNAGDLKLAARQLPIDGAWKNIDVHYYRYEKKARDTYCQGLVEFVVGPEAFRRIVRQHTGGNALEVIARAKLKELGEKYADPLSPDQLGRIADLRVQYDDPDRPKIKKRRVTRLAMNGGARVHEFKYQDGWDEIDYDVWRRKCTETRADKKSQRVVYSSFVGQNVLTELKASENSWVSYRVYEWHNANLLLDVTPSGVDSYQECGPPSDWDRLMFLSRVRNTRVVGSKARISGLDVSLNESDGLFRFLTYSHARSLYEVWLSDNGSDAAKRHIDLISAFQYYSETLEFGNGGKVEVHPLQDISTYILSDSPSTTELTYEWFRGGAHIKTSTQMLKRTATLSAVIKEHNGSGEPDHVVERFDAYGYPQEVVDERGVKTKMQFHVLKGVIKQLVEDADDMALTTDYDSDDLARITKILGPEHLAVTKMSPHKAAPIRRATWNAFKDVLGEVVTGQGYAGRRTGDEHVIAPVAITRLDRAGRVTDEIESRLTGPAEKASLKRDFEQKRWSAWRQHHFDDRDRHDWTRVYHDIPNSGPGSSTSNYDQTLFFYDRLYRRELVVSPGGTFIRTVFDLRGLPTIVQLGQFTPGSSLNKVAVTEYKYDDGEGGGNGNLTKLTQHVEKTQNSDTTVTRITTFKYNWRDQRIRMLRPDEQPIERPSEQEEEELGVEYEHNNVDQVTSINDVPRMYARLPKYDTRGRVYQIEEWFLAYAPGYNTVSKRKLETNVWRDAAGNVLAREQNNGQSHQKFQYDGLGRMVFQCVACKEVWEGEGVFGRIENLAEASRLDDDVVFEQAEMQYDPEDNVISVTTRRRSPGANATSPAQRGRLKSESLSPYARVSHVASWHDALGRVVAEADYGANGVTEFTRSAAVPASSDDVLVLKHAYNYNRQQRQLEWDQIDPFGRVVRTTHDHAGRRIEVVENHTSLGTQPTRLAHFQYTADGLIHRITASNIATGPQTTEYVYGGEMDGVRPSILLDSVKDPEGRGTSFTYNRQQEVLTMTDANKTRHRYGYDKLGRLVCDSIVFALNVDLGVREIGYEYDDEGRLHAITSFDAPRRGDNVGKTVNRVERSYNQFGLITSEFQIHSKEERYARDRTHVDYGYSVGPHAPRLTTVLYAHGGKYDSRERFALWHGYGDDAYSAAVNRCDVLAQGRLVQPTSDPVLSGAEAEAAHTLASYEYFGLADFYYQYTGETFAYGTGWDVTGAIPLTAQWDTGRLYGALDRFDQLQQLTWWNQETDFVEQLGYAYDRLGSRLTRRNRPKLADSTAPITNQHDEAYHYDELYRLKDMGRGTLNNPHATVPAVEPTLATRTLMQKWNLDQQDNWRVFLEDGNGDGMFETVQVRTHDRSNRVKTIMSGGPPVSVAFDDVGNMSYIRDVTDPTDLDKGLYCEYDGWNRLVHVQRGGRPVADYEYDGLGRRIIKRPYTPSGLPDRARHFYYTHDWRLLEERVEESGKKPWQGRIDRRYVWGLRGLDDLVLRDRDTSGDGTLDERLSALSDANGNIVSLYHNLIPGQGGTAQGLLERIEYDPYGRAWFMTPTFAARAESNHDWNILYGGYYYDAETGLYHVRNRMYHPLYGRWLQTDPFGFTDSYNLYQYCLSSPVTYVDPTGEVIPLIVLVGLGVMALGVGVTHYGAHRMTQGAERFDLAEFEAGERWFYGGLTTFAVGGGLVASPVIGAVGTSAAGGLGLAQGSVVHVGTSLAIAGGIEGMAGGLFVEGTYAYGTGASAHEVAASAARGGISGGAWGAATGGLLGAGAASTQTLRYLLRPYQRTMDARQLRRIRRILRRRGLRDRVRIRRGNSVREGIFGSSRYLPRTSEIIYRRWATRVEGWEEMLHARQWLDDIRSVEKTRRAFWKLATDVNRYDKMRWIREIHAKSYQLEHLSQLGLNWADELVLANQLRRLKHYGTANITY